MNLAIALTAIRKGAQCANHVKVLDLIKTVDPKNGLKSVVSGVKVRDELTGRSIALLATETHHNVNVV